MLIAPSSIWNYSDTSPDSIKDILKLAQCMFCRTSLTPVHKNFVRQRPNVLEGDTVTVAMCSQCGWWHAGRREKYPAGGIESIERMYGGYGVLKTLDPSDIEIPIAELRDYLAIKYEHRNQIHPRRFEESVASIFGDLGYQVVVTAYSGDGGIDVILHRGDEHVGVQVKRYKGAIRADQIRELTGALVLGGFTRGIFVTTSRFQPGAEKTAEASGRRGYPIELMDAERFYAALGIAQLSRDRSQTEWLDFLHKRLALLEQRQYSETFYLKV